MSSSDNQSRENLIRYLSALESAHEKRIIKRNLSSICVVFGVFVLLSVYFDIVHLNNLADFAVHILVCAILAVVYFFVNAIFFSLAFSESIREAYKIEQLRSQIYKEDSES